MSKQELIKELNKVNKQIDNRIIVGKEYKKLAITHRNIINALNK